MKPIILGLTLLLLSSCTTQAPTNIANNPTSAPVPPTPSFDIVDFGTCLLSGKDIMESYPRKCRHEDRTYTEHLGNQDELRDQIVLEYPTPNTVLTSPVTIRGRARGTWFFEGIFPVSLTNWDGLIIAEAPGTGRESWLTEEFIPFEATLTFDTPTYRPTGTLILQRDNPSGLPENDAALEIPVLFGQ